MDSLRMVKTMLFLSRRNAARTHMAEALARAMFGRTMKVMSAGLEPGRLEPLAVAAMAEIRLDISRHEPKPVRLIAPGIVDLVVVLDQDDLRPAGFSACRWMSWPLAEVPPADATDATALSEYRRIRDELGERLMRLGRVME